MWRVHIEGDIKHVWPDDEQHVLDDSQQCWCSVSSQILDDGTILITHSSRDGREYIERLVDSATQPSN